MKYIILSDIHSNLEALQTIRMTTVFKQADKIVCLGDVVGYAADPDICIREVFNTADHIVRGNHDKAIADLMNIKYFNTNAQQAILWSKKNIHVDNIARLKALPRGPLLIDELFLICHGSPMNEDRYIFRDIDVKASLDFIRNRYSQIKICFYGHTHVPAVHYTSGNIIQPRGTVKLNGNSIYLINPGSVGQPRDGSSQASFLQFDSNRFECSFFRVDYPISETQQKIISARLPVSLATRLILGR